MQGKDIGFPVLVVNTDTVSMSFPTACLFISTRKGLVDTEDVGLALINDIRKIAAFHVKFSFYQEQAISDVVKPATYRIRFETGSGEVISNEVLYRAESKAVAPGDRIVVLSFDLQKKNYDLNDRKRIINRCIEKTMDL